MSVIIRSVVMGEKVSEQEEGCSEVQVRQRTGSKVEEISKGRNLVLPKKKSLTFSLCSGVHPKVVATFNSERFDRTGCELMLILIHLHFATKSSLFINMYR